MINYKEEIAKILADADIGLSFDEIKEIVEVPSDSKMGVMRSLALSSQRC